MRRAIAAACMALALGMLLPACALAQDLDVLMEQFDCAVDDVSGMDTKDQAFESVYIDPQTFADALHADDTARAMLSQLPILQEDAAGYATRRNAELRMFERPSGSYAAVMLPLSDYDTVSFFFSRRYADAPWKCIGTFPMGNVALMEDAEDGVWFSGTQQMHGTGVAGIQTLYSPEKCTVVLSYTPQYRDYPLIDRSVELVGSLLMDSGEVAVKHYLRGEGLWSGEATVVDFYEKQPDGGFRRTGRTIMDTVDVIATENRLNISELKDFLGA